MKKWFGLKRYGWGWVPVTWEGWTVVLVYIGLVTWLAGSDNEGLNLGGFWVPFGLLTALLIYIGYKKGGQPRWRWGGK